MGMSWGNMYNKNFMSKTCLILTSKNHANTTHFEFRKQDRSAKTDGNQAALKFSERHKNHRTKGTEWQHGKYYRCASNTRMVNTPNRSYIYDEHQFNEHQKVDITGFGASSHFLQVDAPLLHKHITTRPITVTVANGQKVRSTHNGALDVPGLPLRARYAPLLSIVRLFNYGREVVFGRWGVSVEVRYKEKVIIKGRKSMINGLWYVPITDISEDNSDEHNQETANHTNQVEETFQITNMQEFNTPTQHGTVQLDCRSARRTEKINLPTNRKD